MANRVTAVLGPQSLPQLPHFDLTEASSSTSPAIKRIQNDADIVVWQNSAAYRILVLFLARLCESAVGKQTRVSDKGKEKVGQYPENRIDAVLTLLEEIQSWAMEIEPLKTPQRFGNLAFRSWGQRLEERLKELHERLLPSHLYPFVDELQEYFLGSFGSWIRLDYGSGHELSFLAWLLLLMRLKVFSITQEEEENAIEERLAIEVIPKYLEVVWTLQDRYGLEPAGSHGVWGLDDYQFIPYAIGAAQLRNQNAYLPISTASSSHKPNNVKISIKDLLLFVPTAITRTQHSTGGPPFANLYTSSIARIHSLKRGPFSEHSPILYDVATTVPNWIKVHSGMMKMWEAECLGKKPVVQHFPFGGSCFVWEGELRNLDQDSSIQERDSRIIPTAHPWKSNGTSMPPTASPRAKASPAMPLTAAPWALKSSLLPTLRHAQPTQSHLSKSMASTGSAAAASSPFGIISRPSVPSRSPHDQDFER